MKYKITRKSTVKGKKYEANPLLNPKTKEDLKDLISILKCEITELKGEIEGLKNLNENLADDASIYKQKYLELREAIFVAIN